MAIEDSDPERRNLTVMSGAFIVYYLAGGSFDEKQITLEVVNMHFSRPTVLATIAWLMLFWFIYRYWQNNRGKFASEFPKELDRFQERRYFDWYLNRTLPVSGQSNYRYYPAGLSWKEKRLRISYSLAQGVKRNASGKITNMQGPTTEGKHVCEDFLGWMLAITSSIECCIEEPSFANYVMPYILAAFAITCGVANFALSLLTC